MMFNPFKKEQPSIDSISIPTFGWNITKDDQNIKQWINEEQTKALSINFFHQQPDLPSIRDIEKLRNHYRNQIVEVNGGIIEVERIEISGFKVIRTIFKIPQEVSGITYLISLTIPFHSCSYVVKIQALEVGVTGMRESIVTDRLLKENKIISHDTGFIGWSKDPYLHNYNQGTLMNLSELSEYDEILPKHHLSVSRKLIHQIETEIELKDLLKKLKPFK